MLLSVFVSSSKKMKTIMVCMAQNIQRLNRSVKQLSRSKYILSMIQVVCLITILGLFFFYFLEKYLKVTETPMQLVPEQLMHSQNRVTTCHHQFQRTKGQPQKSWNGQHICIAGKYRPGCLGYSSPKVVFMVSPTQFAKTKYTLILLVNMVLSIKEIHLIVVSCRIQP